jgi:hypothetical protein
MDDTTRMGDMSTIVFSHVKVSVFQHVVDFSKTFYIYM